MADAVRRSGWLPWLTRLALLLSLGGVTLALIGAVGSGQGAWHFRIGFTLLTYAFYAAIAGAVLALIGLIAARWRRTAKPALLNLLALVVALGFLLYVGSLYRTAKSVPAIHDISTNLDDLPQFQNLPVRADNLEKIPDNGDPTLKALDPESRWKALHRQGYADLKTVTVPWSPAETIQRAARLAERRGWDIARTDPNAGRLEATDTTFFFRFKDDVVLRARPEPSGGSKVDMRSISRVGGSDVGMNAKRIRAFLDDLSAS